MTEIVFGSVVLLSPIALAVLGHYLEEGRNRNDV